MKSILMSIQPKWCEKIFNGEKTIEVRKTAPKPPFKVYVYCTKGENLYLDYECMPSWSGGFHINENNSADYYNDQLLNGKVIGEFVCDKVDEYNIPYPAYFNEVKGFNELCNKSCLTKMEIHHYAGKKSIKALHITALKIYDKPRDLSEYFVYNKELEKRFIDGDDFCCHDATNEYGEAMTECDGENIHNCYRCWEEWSGWCHRITRPPQSWQYVGEIEE